jgi:serine/threonine protein kinase
MTATTAPEPVVDPGWLLQELVDARIISSEQSRSIVQNFETAGLGHNAQALAEFLTQAGLLTHFQAGQALAGKAPRLVLGPYLLMEPIGSGSLGVVYRAVHHLSRKRFAVKQLPLRSLWNVIQAKKQVQTFASLPVHHAILPFVDIDTAAGSHYLVWPFIEGETFENLVRRSGVMPPSHVVRFMADVFAGLAICHRAGIAHGLLKPSNILLGPDRKAHILDFGIGAILSENISEDESLMDTISTANVAMSMIDCTPPETFANPTTRTPAGDVYSLGCVMYFLLTGSYPFPDGNVVDKMIAHQMQEPISASNRNSNVPEGLSHIIEHMMRKTPDDRPQDLDAIIAAMTEIVPVSGPSSGSDLPRPQTGRTQDIFGTNAPWQQSSGTSSGEFSDPGSSLPGTAEMEESVNFNFDGNVETPVDQLAKSGKKIQDSSAVNYFDPKSEIVLEGLQPVMLPSEPIRQIVLQSRQIDKADQPASGKAKKVRSMINDVELPPTAIQWTTGETQDLLSIKPVTVPVLPNIGLGFFRKCLRKFFPTKFSADVVQFSLFGPIRLVPGQTFQFQAYSHPPESFNSVRTISRAFAPDTDYLGGGFSQRLIKRGTEIGLHLTLANTGVAKSLLRFLWVGQSKPWTFEVHVPWEAPSGVTPGILTMGLGHEQIGQVPFEIIILPRSA